MQLSRILKDIAQIGWRGLPLLLLALGAAGVSGAPATPRVGAYVCSKGDGTEDIEPGRCSKCGADLVPASRELSAALLVFDGVQIIDYCEPYEVFGQARCRTFTVAKTRARSRPRWE